MPVYEFECGAHGCFDEQRPMSQAKSDAICPACGAQARRVLSVPHVAQLARPERRARDINERNAHEPRVVQRSSTPTQESTPRKVHASHGRPWAIGH